jgi:Zn-dependent protease/CBS domain-containing protein
MPGTLKLGRIAGIEIGIHYTLLLAVALITWSLAQSYFPEVHPGASAAQYWLLGLTAAVGLFGSVLVHELSHSLVALARGLGVHSITLFIFGGVSNITSEGDEPKDEFLVAIVGPLSSFELAAIFAILAQVFGTGVAGTAAGYLAVVNLSLGIFNLVPGFPLDGGRVLRSILWSTTGSRRWATEIASYAGQGVGFLLIAWGVYQVFGGQFFNGVWIAFIGWFLNNSAEATRQQQAVDLGLRRVRVSEIMNATPPIASPQMSIQEFVAEHVTQRGQRALLVAERGPLLGLVSVSDVRKVPQQAWATTPVERIMTPAPLKTTVPDADLSAALRLLADGTLNQVPVVRGDRAVGLLSRADVLRVLRMHDELGFSPVSRGSGQSTLDSAHPSARMAEDRKAA